MSLDGFMAGNGDVTPEHPFGDIEPIVLHAWQFKEPEKHKAEHEALVTAGAYIMGRNMFGPKELPSDWKGWWGDEPEYHGPVFVLTHTPHEPIFMKGGTTFYFVTDGLESAMKQAQAAAGTKTVAVAGGASVINQCLAAGYIDELWLHIVPVIIGNGRRLFENTPGIKLKPLEVRTTDMVTHIRYAVLHD